MLERRARVRVGRRGTRGRGTRAVDLASVEQVGVVDRWNVELLQRWQERLRVGVDSAPEELRGVLVERDSVRAVRGGAQDLKVSPAANGGSEERHDRPLRVWSVGRLRRGEHPDTQNRTRRARSRVLQGWPNRRSWTRYTRGAPRRRRARRRATSRHVEPSRRSQTSVLPGVRTGERHYRALAHRAEWRAEPSWPSRSCASSQCCEREWIAPRVADYRGETTRYSGTGGW